MKINQREVNIPKKVQENSCIPQFHILLLKYAGEATPTKARLTSKKKTPKSNNLPGAP
jgi:hypothetical protein